jgi:hypothetical protein
MVATVMVMLPAQATSSAAQRRPPSQRPPAITPEQVARAVVQDDSTGDWPALLRLAHPDALARFRGLQTFQLRMLGSAEWSASDSLGVDSLGADSALQSRWQRSRTRQVRFMLDSVFKVPDLDSLARTSPDTVFARWFRGTRGISTGDSGVTPPARPPAYRVIGAVRASDSVAYVVVERDVVQPLGPMPEMFRDFPRETLQAEVMVMRRRGREWKSMLDGVGEPYGYGADLGQEE